jgi:hypothetical protein
VTVTTVNVEAKVTAAIGGCYGSKPGYRLYHHTARVDLSAAVAPAKPGECVQFQVQKYVAKTWRAVATTGCATLNSKSQASGYLVEENQGAAIHGSPKGFDYRTGETGRSARQRKQAAVGPTAQTRCPRSPAA